MIFRRFVFFAILALAAVATSAQQKAGTPPKPADVPTGRYGCVFSFGGQFFDSKPVSLLPDQRYETAGDNGEWQFRTRTKTVSFLSGPLARDFPTARFFASGVVPGGLKNRRGPAFVLKPSASYIKLHGSEAVPRYCYLQAR